MRERILEKFQAHSIHPTTSLLPCSALEIYNEEVYDLNAAESTRLEVREDPGRGVYVDGLQEMPVVCLEDTTAVLERVMARRAASSTAMNAQSSRSHVVVTITAVKVGGGGGVKGMEEAFPHTQTPIPQQTDAGDRHGFTRRRSKLHLVDLAGSERLKRSQAEGQAQKEGEEVGDKNLAGGPHFYLLLFTRRRHQPLALVLGQCDQCAGGWPLARAVSGKQVDANSARLAGRQLADE